jgi:hypothetical protein
MEAERPIKAIQPCSRNATWVDRVLKRNIGEVLNVRGRDVEYLEFLARATYYWQSSVQGIGRACKLSSLNVRVPHFWLAGMYLTRDDSVSVSIVQPSKILLARVWGTYVSCFVTRFRIKDFFFSYLTTLVLSQADA